MKDTITTLKNKAITNKRPPHLTLYAVGVFKLAKVLVILTTVLYTDKQRLLKVS